MISCPGCGGHNQPEAKTCEWCGRPFLAQPRRLLPPLLAFGAAAVLAGLLLVAAAIALLSVIATLSSQILSEPPAAPAPLTPTPSPEAAREVSVTSPESTPPLAEFVRIANTGGTGAFLRAEPRSPARGIVAHPDRTVLRIIGPDVVTEGRVWRNVEDQRGTRGWTPAEFLVASDVGF